MTTKTMTIRRDAWYMRWLRWCAGPPELHDPNFCLLFWGLLLSPALALLRLLGKGADALSTIEAAARAGDKVAAWNQRHKTAWEVIGVLFLAGVTLYWVGLIFYLLYQIAWWVTLLPANIAVLAYVAGRLLPMTEVERVLSVGYHAVKDRTCPTVRVEPATGPGFPDATLMGLQPEEEPARD